MGYQRQEVQAASYEYIPIGMGYQRNGLPAAVGELSGQCIEWLTTQLKRKLRLAPPTDCKPAVVHAPASVLRSRMLKWLPSPLDSGVLH